MSYTPKNPNGQDTMADSSPVVIASDQSAVPVSGTVTANLGATDNAVLDAIEADTTAIAGSVDGIEALLTTIDADTGAIVTAVQTLDNAIAGSEMQVDVVAALPSGTNNIGDVDVLSMPGTGVEDAAETAGGTLLMSGSVRRDTAASSAGTTGDNATINTDSVGALWTRDTATQVDDAAFTPATGRVMPVGYLADETATDSVDEGDAGAARMTLDRKQIVATYAHAAGGATAYKLVSAASTNATSVKASAGTVYMITASNVNAAARYLKLYNKASAPTVGTDTPAFTFIIPGNTAGAGTNIPVPNVGINFGTGIAFALTTEATDAGTTGVAASEIVVNLAYA